MQPASPTPTSRSPSPATESSSSCSSSAPATSLASHLAASTAEDATSGSGSGLAATCRCRVGSTSSGRCPSPVQLEPFVHQVGGHFPMVCLDADVVCKPLNEREHTFYKTMPSVLKPFAPEFQGTMKVETREDEDGYITLRGQPPRSYVGSSAASPSSATSASASSGDATPSIKHVRLKRTESVEIETVVSSESDGCSDVVPSDNSSSVGFPPPVSGASPRRSADDPAAIFCNPWALKCHRDHLRKLGLLRPQTDSSEDNGGKGQQIRPETYLLLENLVSRYRYPCVLDLKVGVRQYPDEVSAAKKQRKMAKSANTTSSTLGLRLCGMQYYNPSNGQWTCHNKYYGRTLSANGFTDTISQFLSGGELAHLHQDVLAALIEKLEALQDIIAKLDSFRFYTSSLLVTYDAGRSSSISNGVSSPIERPRDDVHVLAARDSFAFTRIQRMLLGMRFLEQHSDVVDVRIIDFAHSTHKELRDAVLHVGPDESFLFGLRNFIAILRNMTSQTSEIVSD